MDFLTLLAPIFGGGATGLIGVVAQRYFDLKAKDRDLELIKANNDHALALAKYEHEAAKERLAAEADLAQDRWAHEEAAQAASSELRLAELDSEVRIASMENDGARYSLGLQMSQHAADRLAEVDVLRGKVRPYATAALMIMELIVIVAAFGLVLYSGRSAIPPDAPMQFLFEAYRTLAYMSTTSLTWWFGVRPSQPGKTQ